MATRQKTRAGSPVAQSTESTAEFGTRVRRHLLAGWLGLLVFMSLGLALEVLQGLKIDFYLDLRNGTRRLLWTLAHTHGTLFSLVNIAFAWTCTQIPDTRWLQWASPLLITAQWLMPLGFFLGGCWLHGGDPNLLILLAPVGGLMLIGAAIAVTHACYKKPKSPPQA